MLKEVPKIDFSNNETGCCPRFKPEEWDGKIMDLSAYSFARTSTKSLFYMPLNLGKVMTKAMTKIDEQRARLEDTYLILSEDISPFRANHYFAVAKPLDEMENCNLKGSFLTKVFEGPFSQMGKWMKEMNQYANEQKVELERILAFYTTCPKCAKVYGKNYVVLFGKVKE